MFKKISFLLFALAILVTGYVASDKLNYWERSVRIFSIKNQNLDGRRGRGQFGNEGFSERGRRGGFERPGIRELPDSIRVRFGEGRGGRDMRSRNAPDSLLQRQGRSNRELSGRDSFEPGTRNSRDRGRGNLIRGRKIYLRNVLWFLAVFASFTVMTIYIDKANIKIRKKRFRE